jgi:hypothetical protein
MITCFIFEEMCEASSEGHMPQITHCQSASAKYVRDIKSPGEFDG